MAKYGNENAAAGGMNSSTAGRDAMYGGRSMPDRPDKGPHGGWTTPNYSWDQAKLSDFGIMGGLSNMIGGVMAGNTYAGRTPSGFSTGQSRDLGALGPKAQGNTGGKSWGAGMPPSGVAGLGAGAQNWFRALMAQQAKPATPATPAIAPNLTASTVPAATLGGPIPGLQDYSVNLPSYGYFGAPGQSRPQITPQTIAAMLRIVRGGPGYETGMIGGGVK